MRSGCVIELVVVENRVFSTTAREMRKARITETGGPLVGHRDGHHLVVTGASGPGPRAELRLRSVEIDGVHAERFCAAARSKTNGLDDYVGDWHCHVGYSLEPSRLDHQAMKTMAEFQFGPTRTPVSLIWSKWSDKVRAYYYDGTETLKELRVVRPV